MASSKRGLALRSLRLGTRGGLTYGCGFLCGCLRALRFRGRKNRLFGLSLFVIGRVHGSTDEGSCAHAQTAVFVSIGGGRQDGPDRGVRYRHSSVDSLAAVRVKALLVVTGQREAFGMIRSDRHRAARARGLSDLPERVSLRAWRGWRLEILVLLAQASGGLGADHLAVWRARGIWIRASGPVWFAFSRRRPVRWHRHPDR